MKATRLPNKPLALVNGVPMIVQVWRRAMESGLGDVIVACDGEEIAQAIRAEGGVAMITDPDLPSGSDRIWQALQRLEKESSAQEFSLPLKGRAGVGPFSGDGFVPDSGPLLTSPLQGEGLADDIIINLQGDVPTLEPRLLAELLKPLANPAVDIATLAAPITRAEEHENPAVVKIVMAQDGRALYFTRAAAPYGDGTRYHHIGVYAYRRAALERFVALPPSMLEQREKLEQLRALEAGMRIDVAVVQTVPLGVDTPEDLVRANEVMKGNGQ